MEILDQYGVKATFFVLENEGRAEQLKKVSSKGHEIAVHSSCHDYDTLYADLDSSKTTTIEALERVLPILIDEGYGFSKIKRDTTQIDFEAYD